MNTISCLIDFSEPSKKAVSYAIWLAKKYNASINLVHFASHNYDEEAVKEKLVSHSEIKSTKFEYTCSVGSGEFLKKIPEMLRSSHADLVVIGSHEAQSSSELLSAGNIVKLLRSLPIPALIINQNSTIPVPPIKDILFPLAPHNNFTIKIEESAKWAKLHDAQIDVFCLVSEENSIPDDISKNLDQSLNYFDEANIKHAKTLKASKVYSVGFAKDILHYAEEKHFDLIAIMSQNSEENMYFGDVEKTNLIQNSLGIPILSVNR